MKRSTISSFGAVVLIISSVVQAGESSAASSPRITALALQPSQFDASKNYSLLPKPEELTEGDAVALYNKAVADMPENMDVGRLRNWTRIPLSELPQDQVQTFLQQAQPAMQAIAEAAVCRSCNWPPFQAGTMPASLSEYRNLAYLVYLKARLEIARKQYDDAVATIRTGLAMARHIGEAPTVVQGLVGVATAAVMLRAVDDLAQTPDSANLYGALAALPRPLIDLEKPIASELKALESNPQYNASVRRALRKQMEQSYVRVRQLGGRLDGDIAVHQCIQALRHYAATHDDRLPTELSDITGVELPNDPVTQKPFMYHLDGTKAVLEMGVPEGGRPSESMRYEITVAR